MDLLHIIGKARSVITVELVLLLYMLGAFLQFTTIQQLIYYKVCLIKYNDTVMCNNLSSYEDEEKIVTTDASHWLIILNVALTVPSVISSLFLGSWSDNVGRKSVILLPTVGTIIYCCFCIISASLMHSSIWIIIAGQAILGATGAYPILTSAVFSYMGDITTKENRTFRFGILESMTFIGSFIGLLTSGIVIDNLSFVAPFIIVICCEVLIVLYVLLWLKESVTQYGRHGMPERVEESVEADLGQVENKNMCAELFKMEHLFKSFASVFRDRPQKRRVQVIFLVLCLFIFELVGAGERDTTIYYVKKQPLEWDATLIGFYAGFKNLAKTLGLLVALPLVHKLGVQDPTIATGATVLRMGGYILMAFARTTVAMFSVIFFMAFAGIPPACTRAMLSKLVSPFEQGSLFSFTAVMETLTGFLGSLLFNALYPATLDIIQGGFIYLLMAGLLVLPVILLMWVRDLMKCDVTYQLQDEPQEGKDITADT